MQPVNVSQGGLFYYCNTSIPVGVIFIHEQVCYRRLDSMVKKKKNEITIRSSAAEYLTFVASTGENQDNFEIRYEDENIWLTQKIMATLYDVEAHTIN